LLPFPSRKISLGSDFPRKTEFPREIKKSFCDLAEGDVKKSQESIKVGYERKKVENRKKKLWPQLCGNVSGFGAWTRLLKLGYL
jgi:hypothetical protein